MNKKLAFGLGIIAGLGVLAFAAGGKSHKDRVLDSLVATLNMSKIGVCFSERVTTSKGLDVILVTCHGTGNTGKD